MKDERAPSSGALNKGDAEREKTPTLGAEPSVLSHKRYRSDRKKKERIDSRRNRIALPTGTCVAVDNGYPTL